MSPPPVIAPSAVEKRLSKTELRIATSAFYRARGYGDRIDFPRFRDTVVQEAFDAMPLYIVQRVFMVWNYVDGSTGGALTLEEFLVGVTIAWKGTREEHFRFVFQLMGRSSDMELSKRDAVVFLKAVARENGVVAVEEPSGRHWTAEEFAAGVLFTSETTVLTVSKFLTLMAGRSFTSLAFVDWIPKLASQFEREKAKVTAAITPVTKGVDDQGDDMTASILIKLRRLSHDKSPVAAKSKSAGTWSPVSPLANTGRLVESENGPQKNSIFQIETMAADQFQSLKAALSDLIEWALETNEPVSDADIQRQLTGVVSSTLLRATMNTATLCAGDFVLATSSSDKTASAAVQDAVTCQAKVQVFWWMLCLCCSCARSSAEVFRYLFVLFDEESRGFWTMSQLKMFIRCVDFQNEEQSSSDEAAFLAQTVMDELEATKQQQQQTLGPSEPSRIAEEEPVMFQFRDFEKYLVRYPIAGCSPANVDVVFTLFHTQLARARGQQLSHRSYLDALSSLCHQLTTYEITTQHGFCLLLRSSWERVVDWICDYDSDLPLATSLKTSIATTVDMPQCCPEGEACQTTDLNRALVAVPISLWLVVAMRLQERHFQQATSHHHWTQSASRLRFSTNSDDENGNIDQRNGSWVFHGLVATLDLSLVARDGSECRITMPHCVVDQELSLQTLVQTALTLHGHDQRGTITKAGRSLFATHPPGAFYCEGEVVFSREGGAHHHQQVSQDAILLALNALDEGANSHRLAVKMNVLLTDERTNSSIPRWPAGALLSSPASSQQSTSSSPSSRTPRRSKRSAAVGWTKVHGLANLGNTCFMNSALQCLAATPVLREYFLKSEHLYDLQAHTTPTAGSLASTGRKPTQKIERVLPKSSLLPVAFGQLLAEMNAYSSNGSVSGMADVVSPKHMKGAVATLFPHLSDGTQQDAQEFLSSLLSSLSDELKRLPVVQSDTPAEPLTSVNSPSLLSRFVTKPVKSEPLKRSETSGQSALSKLRFQVNDSDGRSDEIVAKEWWISHLVTEPSIITALFCGQFKSTLCCSHCGYTSTRFEPFSSLQLPLLDETAMLSPRQRPQHQQITVILHFLDSPCHTQSLRLVVQAGLDWTVEQLLIKIQQNHATYSSAGTRRDYIAVSLSGFVIDDYIDPDALLSTVSTPLQLFEIEYGDQARSYNNGASSFTFQPGDSVLARASHERWVRGVVERPSQVNSTNGSLSPVRSPSSSSATYHIRINEANCGTTVCLNPCDLRPLTTDRLLLLRFVHRRPGLVPFYATSPYRQLLCGFPFVYRLPFSLLCGRVLYHTIYGKFCAHDETSLRRSFVLRRVRRDGKSCGKCHWSDQCSGCLIDRLDEEPLLDLEMDETIAIDWLLDAHEPVAEWLSSGYCIEDHTSYVAFKLDNTYTLEKSLEILCSSEHVEARCGHCPKKVPVDAEQLISSGTELPSPTTSPFVAHTKSLALWSLPPILVIQLKRFELVADGGFTYQRLNHNVDFPVENFDISAFLSPAERTNPLDSHAEREEVARAESFLTGDLQFPTTTTSRDELSRYHLYGVVNHMGDLGGGHYTANIRHPDNGDWWLVDDASATPANPQNLAPSCSAYLLFYVRGDLDPTVEDDDDHDQEEHAFMTTTDLPRNRRRVPLSEFYPRHNHATRVDDAAIRALCKQDVWPRTASRTNDPAASSSKPSDKRDDGNCVLM